MINMSSAEIALGVEGANKDGIADYNMLRYLKHPQICIFIYLIFIQKYIY